MADYGITTTVDAGFAATVERTRAALAVQGFGILTEIDVAATMKAKLGIDMPPYLILGACNPPLAHQAITLAPSMGLLLPCNVVVRAVDDDHTLVEAMNPDLMVALTDEPDLKQVAENAREKLTAAIDTLDAVG
jgi:uncharacterized protein (DUF302 family)